MFSPSFSMWYDKAVDKISTISDVYWNNALYFCFLHLEPRKYFLVKISWNIPTYSIYNFSIPLRERFQFRTISFQQSEVHSANITLLEEKFREYNLIPDVLTKLPIELCSVSTPVSHHHILPMKMKKIWEKWRRVGKRLL